MAEEKNVEQQTEQPKKSFHEKVKELVETKIEKLMETGIQVSNVDYFYKLILGFAIFTQDAASSKSPAIIALPCSNVGIMPFWSSLSARD